MSFGVKSYRSKKIFIVLFAKRSVLVVEFNDSSLSHNFIGIPLRTQVRNYQGWMNLLPKCVVVSIHIMRQKLEF